MSNSFGSCRMSYHGSIIELIEGQNMCAVSNNIYLHEPACL